MNKNNNNNNGDDDNNNNWKMKLNTKEVIRMCVLNP